MVIYQDRMAAWVRTTFGEASLTDRWERAARVVEEAIELAQAEGLTGTEVERILNRVYSQRAGEVSQEAAGVMTCLLAWAAGTKTDLAAVTLTEIERIERPETVERCLRKQFEKRAAGTARYSGRLVLADSDTILAKAMDISAAIKSGAL